jgi:hypothetical protein
VGAKNLVVNLQTADERLTGCVVENISMGGILARTGGKLPDGATVHAEFLGPGLRKALRIEACVVGLSLTPRGMRLQFLQVEGEDKLRLAELLESFGLKRPAVGTPTASKTPSPYAAQKTPSPVSTPPAPAVASAPPQAAGSVPPTPGAAASRTTPSPLAAPRPIGPIGAGGPPMLYPTARTSNSIPPAAPPQRPAGDVQAIERLVAQVKELTDQLAQAQQRIAMQQDEINELRAQVASLRH